MKFKVEILADSLFSNGVRLTTARWVYPRSILAEVDTHRAFSRNSGSSRAIPVAKMIRNLMESPFIPKFKKNQKGMAPAELLEGDEKTLAEYEWLRIRDVMIQSAELLSDSKGLDVAKGYTNRLLEPWMWAETIISSTDWSNMFAQRVHKAAEPSFQEVAGLMYEAYSASTPKIISCLGRDRPCSWHIPYYDKDCVETRNQFAEIQYEDAVGYLKDKLGITDNEYTIERFNNRRVQDMAVGRLTKVCYLNLDTQKIDVLNDIRLAVQLSRSRPGHWSPFEHVATMAQPSEMSYKIAQLTYNSYASSITPKEGEVGYSGNFKGCLQYRKEFADENILEFSLQ